MTQPTTRSTPRRTIERNRGERLPASFRRLAKHSYGSTGTGNAVIQGENLLALKFLHAKLAGRIRCIYIDPPYNNQEQYTHYNDTLDHDEWIAEISKRLKALKPLLTQDGSIWISIDDRQLHYLKVAADRIFGRERFVTTIVWQQRTTRENRRVFSNNHEYLLVYATNPRAFGKGRNLMPPSSEQLARYKNPDGDPRGPWQSISANVQNGHATPTQFYDLVAPNGKVHRPPEGRCWVYTKEKMQSQIAARSIWFGHKGDGVPRIKRFLRDSKLGLTPDTLWLADDVGTNDQAKKQILQLFPEEPVFDTPKPEGLVARILEIATNEGDLVLDAYLGVGATAAVAHKMRRRYVGIELNEIAATLSASRLRRVVEGDMSGVSLRVGWTGGGGFDYYRVRT